MQIHIVEAFKNQNYSLNDDVRLIRSYLESNLVAVGTQGVRQIQESTCMIVFLLELLMNRNVIIERTFIPKVLQTDDTSKVRWLERVLISG